MLHPRLARLLLVVALLASAAGARADVSLSQSNAPAAILDAELGALFGNEHQAMEAVSPARVKRLQSRPTGGLFARRAPRFSYSREYLGSLPVAKGGKSWRCLSEALYFEARGESVKGQFAVAEVVLNRVDSPKFPDTVCAVINQGTGRRFQCQFTYRCDGRKETITDRVAWEEVGKVARIVLDGKKRDLTGGATYYHARSVRPRWARKFSRTAAIGAHFFYRLPLETAQLR